MGENKNRILNKVHKIQHRLNRTLFINSLVNTAVVGFLAAAAALMGYFVWLYSQTPYTFISDWQELSTANWQAHSTAIYTAIGVVAFSLALGIFWYTRYSRDELEAAQVGDASFHLKDRLSTATQLIRRPSKMDPEMVDALLQDSARHADDVEPSHLSGVNYTSRISLLPLAFLSCLFSLAIIFCLQPPKVTAAPLTPEERAAKMLEKTAKEIEIDAKKTGLKDGLDLAKILKKAANELKKVKNDPKKNSKEILNKKINQIKSKYDPKKKFEAALRKAVQALKQSKATKDVAKSLEKKNFPKAEKGAKGLQNALKNKKANLDAPAMKKMKKAAGKAAKALSKTKLQKLAKILKEISKHGDPKKSDMAKNSQKDKGKKDKGQKDKGKKDKMAKNAQKDKGKKDKGKKGQKGKMAKAGKGKKGDSKNMSKKALKALQAAKKMVQGSKQLAQKKKLPVYKGKLPQGKGRQGNSKNSRTAKNQPPQYPHRPGPTKKGKQGKGQGRQGKQKIWKGPCTYKCPCSGPCLKCPCRNHPKGVNPYTNRFCECKHCISYHGGGSGQGSGQGQGQGKGWQPGQGGQQPGQGAGKGGLQAGKGTGNVKGNTKKADVKTRKTYLRGVIGKKGESEVMAVKSLQKEKSSRDYQKSYSKYKAESEDAVKKSGIPQSKRTLIERYFDAIKPNE